MATRRSRWFLVGVLSGLLLLPQLLLAQPLILGVSFPQWERLNDRELQQWRGQGTVTPTPEVGKSLAAIKLWDEWASGHMTPSLGNPAKNQVLLFSPAR